MKSPMCVRSGADLDDRPQWFDGTQAFSDVLIPPQVLTHLTHVHGRAVDVDDQLALRHGEVGDGDGFAGTGQGIG